MKRATLPTPEEALAILADPSRDVHEREACVGLLNDDPATLPHLTRIASDPAEDEGLQQKAAEAIGCIWLNQDRIETGDDSGFTPWRERKSPCSASKPPRARLASR